MSLQGDSFCQTTRVVRFARTHLYLPIRGRPGVIQSPTEAIDLPSVPIAFERLLHQLPLATHVVVSEAEKIGLSSLEMLRILADLGVLEDVVLGSSDEELAIARRPHLGSINRQYCSWVSLDQQVFVLPRKSEWIIMHPSTPTTITIGADCAGTILCDLAVGVSSVALSTIGQLFLDNGFLTEDADVTQSTWEFHDTLFHAVSTHGYGTQRGYGAKKQMGRLQPSLPWELLNSREGTFMELTGTDPDLSASFSDILARRRSSRKFSAKSLPRKSLDSLLWLTLHTQQRQPLDTGDYVAFHPYPSGGARDEIMTLLAYASSDEKDASLYIYLNDEHKVFRLHESQQKAYQVIEVLSATCEVPTPLPSAALLFAADYERMSAKYEAIVYATILRNIGAIYQTVSLVAEALGLASCPVGGGWGHLEQQTLSTLLAGRVIVGGMILGLPADVPS